MHISDSWPNSRKLNYFHEITKMESGKKKKKGQNFDELAFLPTPKTSVIFSSGEYIPHYKVVPYFLYLPKRFLLFIQMDNPS